MDTFERLQNIFYSGQWAFTGNHDTIRDIAFLVDNGYLTIRTVVIASKKRYRECVLDVDTHRSSYEAAGGSIEHVALKLLAKEYLVTRQQADVLFEQAWCGYYPDVVTSDHVFVVECGHTQNPEKMLAYFVTGDAMSCIQIPYPDDDDSPIVGHEFTPQKDLKQFLELLESERRKDLKSIINRKRPTPDPNT